MANDMECPYCGAECEVCHDDGQGYAEDKLHQHTCGDCGKTFVFTTSISFYYEPQKADCLNDGKHDWKPSKTYPKCYTRMVCSMCDERREPTDEERAAFKIPTPEEEEAERKAKPRPTGQGKGEL
jgi:hypothetical protein